MSVPMQQLGFDALLVAADHDNKARAFERAAGHLPSSMDDALPYFRDLIARHHDAMLAASVETVMALRKDAAMLARRLNGGGSGYLAGPDAPGCMLERLTAAQPGIVPLWGQAGDFIVTVDGMRVRIELDGVFGIGSSVGFWPGFSAHVVNRDAPFLSETGYRSFLGLRATPMPGMMPDAFVTQVIARHIADERKSSKRRQSQR